jgi:hypothetical protein
MSWHYLQAGEVASWDPSSLDGVPFALSRLIPIAARCFSPDNEMNASSPSRSGMTSERLTVGRGADTSMSSQVGSRAKTSVQPAAEKGSKGRNPRSGSIWLGWFAKYDRDTCLWRTPQLSLLEGLDEYSVAWPRWGLMRDGVCWALAMPALHITEIESGLLPTPTVCQRGNRGGGRNPTGRYRPSLAEMAKRNIWPTPTASPNANRQLKPSPSQLAGRRGMSLAVANARMEVPTPRATDGNRGGSASTSAKRHRDLRVGGPLNPTWVEWLMGWPEGWTDLRPLETGKFREWLRSYGRF